MVAGGKEKKGESPVGMPKSERTLVLEKLKPYWKANKDALSKFAKIASGFDGLKAEVLTYATILDSYFEHLGKDASHNISDDYLMMIHSMFGYRRPGTDTSLIREALAKMVANPDDADTKKVLNELAANIRAGTSRIYGDEWVMLHKNLEDETGVLKNDFWTNFKDYYTRNATLTPDQKKDYQTYETGVTELLQRINKRRM